MALPSAGLLGAGGGMLAQVDAGNADPFASWSSLGATAMIVSAFGMILLAVIRGDFGHLRSKEREEALTDSLREMAAALDRSTEQIGKAIDRERLVQALLIEHRPGRHDDRPPS